MGRALLSFRVADQAGNVQPSVPVLLLEADQQTLLAQTLYAGPSGPATRTNPLLTDSYGLALAYAEIPQRAAAAVGGVITPIDISDDPADVASGAAIVIPPNSITSAMLVDGTIVNADVNAAAGIVVSKLGAGGTASRVVRTSDGATMVMGQVIGGDIQDTQIGANKMNGGGNASTVLRTTDGTTVVWGKVIGGDIQDGQIGANKLDGGGNVNTVLRTTNGTTVVFGQVVNADIAAAAGVALSKLAPGTSGVLKSNGTAISAGNLIVTADMGSNTINGDRITDNTIPSVKLIGGATIPANSIDSSHIVDGSIVNADINAAAGILVSKLAAGGTASRVVKTNDGTTMLLGQVGTNDIAAQQVTTAHIVGPGAGSANTLLRTTNGTDSLFGKLTTNDITLNTINGDRLVDGSVTSAKLATTTIAAGSVTAAELAVGAVTRVALSWTTAADLFVGTSMTSGSYLDLQANQTFSILEAASKVLVMVRGLATVSNPPATTNFMIRPFVDNAAGAQMGGTTLNTGGVGNPFAGCGTLIITGLSVGSHTIRLSILANSTGGLFYLRGTTGFEHLSFDVLEVKR